MHWKISTLLTSIYTNCKFIISINHYRLERGLDWLPLQRNNYSTNRAFISCKLHHSCFRSKVRAHSNFFAHCEPNLIKPNPKSDDNLSLPSIKSTYKLFDYQYKSKCPTRVSYVRSVCTRLPVTSRNQISDAESTSSR